MKLKSSKLFKCRIAKLDKEDGILTDLDSYKRCLVKDLQSSGVPNDVDWSSFRLGPEFSDANFLTSLTVDQGAVGEKDQQPPKYIVDAS